MLFRSLRGWNDFQIIVALSSRDNLKVIPTPEFERASYSVGGFHPAPPLEPNAEAQYWVTPIDPKMSEAKAESKLREYNNYTLKWLTIHEALPGHYVQGEHAPTTSSRRHAVCCERYTGTALTSRDGPSILPMS